MNIHRPEIQNASKMIPDLWKPICLISSDSADHEKILTTALKRWKNRFSSNQSAELSHDIKKLVLELKCEADLNEFKERLNHLNLPQLSITVFYYSFVQLKSIQEIADLLDLDYSSAGSHLRQVFFAFRQQRNFAA